MSSFDAYACFMAEHGCGMLCAMPPCAMQAGLVELQGLYDEAQGLHDGAQATLADMQATLADM